jgi:hypothetical protein
MSLPAAAAQPVTIPPIWTAGGKGTMAQPAASTAITVDDDGCPTVVAAEVPMAMTVSPAVSEVAVPEMPVATEVAMTTISHCRDVRGGSLADVGLNGR